MLMFEWALCAAVMPAQDDWLNDLSSTPPVSSTMQALSALPVDVDDEPLPPGLLDELFPPDLALLPQPESRSAMAATPAIAAVVRVEPKMIIPSTSGTDVPGLQPDGHASHPADQ